MSIKVLIADDHRLILSAVRRALAAADDIEIVAEARRGSQVLPLVHQVQPDVCLLDVRLPVMDGLTCAARIRVAAPDPCGGRSGTAGRAPRGAVSPRPTRAS